MAAPILDNGKLAHVNSVATPHIVGASLEQIQGFPGMGFASDPVQAAPPDTQVAVGPQDVGEAVNSALSLWSRTGTLLGSHDLNSFFSVPVGYSFSDPRIVYDTLSGRWLLSGLSVDAALDGQIYLAVSQSGDPTAGWYIYDLASGTGVFGDQPKIGASSDKVVISWNAFNSGLSFLGEQTWVLQKSDLLAGLSVHESNFSLDNTRFGVVPVISESSTSTEYLVYNNTCSVTTSTGVGNCTTGSASLGVVAITGTPVSTNVAWTENDPAAIPTSNPPPATQLSAVTLATNDDRLLSAVWQNGALWTTANDGCTPSSDSTTRPCLRVFEASVSGSGATINVDGDLGIDGADLYFPAVALDSSGDPFIVASVSSSTTYPGVVAYGEPNASGNFLGSLIGPGAGDYLCSFCGGENRWGDYSGAAIDPSNPSDVWVAGEIGTAAGGDNWGTTIAELTLSSPTISGINPTSGTTSGGTSVSVNGSNFTPGTTVDFGTQAAASVTVTSSTSLEATSPSSSAGGVYVTATTPDGTTPASPSGIFTFNTPPPPPPPPPPVAHGYDLVGSDGGVFVFGGGFYGSLPGIGVHVNNITGIVPTAKDTGYFLVGSDGGVFAFNAPFANSLPGIGVHVDNIVGIVPTLNDKGYFLVGKDGGVFSFNAPFENSLPGIGVHVNDIVGIAATSDDNGYWLVGADGSVYAFGDAHSYGNAPTGAVGITVTHDGHGYWVVGANGAVTAFGDAGKFGDLPSIGVAVDNIVGIVVSADSRGYNLFGSDGGVFSFGNAKNLGSLPGLGVRVNNVVGAVPT